MKYTELGPLNVLSQPLQPCEIGIFFFSKYLSVYLAASGLSCDTWDLLLQRMDSLVVAGVLTSCGTSLVAP